MQKKYAQLMLIQTMGGAIPPQHYHLKKNRKKELIGMTPPDKEHHCTREEQINKHSRKIAGLDARADFKDRRIEEIITKLDKVSDDVQQIMIKSINDDNQINQRLTALEASQSTIYKLIMLVIALIPIIEILFNLRW